ncbi:MAG: TatD family hydrolase, partial [Nanoarchaeota archaeon]
MKNKSCFIDAHCHLDMIEMPIEKIIDNSNKADVNIIIAQGVNPESNRKVLSLGERYDIVKSALGIYPIDAISFSDKEIDSEIEFIRKNKDKIIAIGEVGLDFKEDLENHERQKNIFKKFIGISIELKIPIIVHSRKAELECIEILEKYNAKKVIMHCFSGKLSLIKRIVRNGWMLTIPTSVKNSEHFQKIVEMVDIKNLLCETDSPYLHPDKKWPNEPANVIASYEKIAEIKGLSLENVNDLIKNNYKNLFT